VRDTPQISSANKWKLFSFEKWLKHSHYTIMTQHQGTMEWGPHMDHTPLCHCWDHSPLVFKCYFNSFFDRWCGLRSVFIDHYCAYICSRILWSSALHSHAQVFSIPFSISQTHLTNNITYMPPLSFLNFLLLIYIDRLAIYSMYSGLMDCVYGSI